MTFVTRQTALLALFLFISPAVSGREPARGTGDESFVVEIEARGTDLNKKGEYFQTDSVGSGTDPIELRETGYVYVSAGFFGKGGEERLVGLCMNSTGTPQAGETPEERLALVTEGSPHTWWAEIRPVSAEVGRYTLEVSWAHYYHACRDEEPRVIRGDSRRITLREGESHVLDFIDQTPGPESYCYRNLTIAVSARVKEDPGLQDALLGYDLWLEHRDDRGRSLTRRFRAAGRQGQKLEFLMGELRFPVPGATMADGSGVETILEVLGGVQGRIRGGGSIEVRLGARRWVDVEAAGGPRRGGIGAGGEKVFTMRPGETVRMELPAPGGRIGTGDGVWVDSAEFFAGHQDALILTVTRD